MTNKETKVIATRTKDWQPFMNKLSAKSRKQRKRLMHKRIRKFKGEDND